MKKLIGIIAALMMTTGVVFAATGSDTVPPGDVENVKAVAGDSAVKLSWDIATDNFLVVGYNVYYGTKSVTGEDDTNYSETVSAGDVLEYTVDDLENGVEYYFAVTAEDASGNQSEYYSNEVSSVPVASGTFVVTKGDDKEAPKVIGANAPYDDEVIIRFSELVILSGDHPEDAFTIQDNDTLEILDILNVKTPNAGDTVSLTTDKQKEGVSYIVTAGIEIEDEKGNPIISGVSDVAIFKGSAKTRSEEAPVEKAPAEEDNKAPEIKEVKSVSDTEVTVEFNEQINLSVDPTDNFEIVLESDENQQLDISKIELEEGGVTVTIITEKQSKISYSLIVTEIEDKSGNVISEEDDANKIVFSGKGETTLLDLVAPENITGLVTKAVNGAVNLSWQASLNSENDLAKLILYKSKDKGNTYDNGTQISSDATSFSVYGLEAGTEYYFKVTAKDEAGNENTGSVTSAILPATGPAGVGFLALASIVAGFMTRRKFFVWR